ncbi:hypothetical protein OM7_05675, partial [Enterococcus faecium EnGen0046]
MNEKSWKIIFHFLLFLLKSVMSIILTRLKMKIKKRLFLVLTHKKWFYNILCWWKIESDFLLTLFSSFQLKKRLTFG